MRKELLLLTVSLLFGSGIGLYSQSTHPVRMVNTGQMAVAANGDSTALYVPNSILMADAPSSTGSQVSILQNGITAIGGSFYQNSASNVFVVGTDGWGTSTGTIAFVGTDPTGVRHIRTQTAGDMAAFDRAAHYVAFPNLLIATDDTIKIPGRMGIDAATIKQDSSKKGIVYLRSEVEGTSDKKVFDASLRISAVGATTKTSAALVDLGSVVVEKDISIYRSDAGQLFPFASPYTNQHAGYFAGNLVRQFLEESPSGHVEYVLANEDANGDGKIDRKQYLVSMYDQFEKGKGYLIKPRPAGYNYGDLPLIEIAYDGSNLNLYEAKPFVFNGGVYGVDFGKEQLFADEVLFSTTHPGTDYGKTVNLIIGNSYTSALDFDKLCDALANTGLTVSPNIYYFHPGTTSWQVYNMQTGTGTIPFREIPAMTTLMVRLSKTAQTGNLTIGRDMQTHGKMSNNFLVNGQQQFNNELVFRVSPEDNNNVYDMAMIALRGTNSGSADKIINSQVEGFQLYASNKKAIAIEPTTAQSTPLTFIPSEYVSGYNLSVSRIESMTTEGLWLEDKKTGRWVDLRETNEYAFEATPDDIQERFIVHYANRMPTDLDNLNIYYRDRANEVVIHGLTIDDMGTPIHLRDIQGRLLISSTVNNYPEMIMSENLQSGVYLVHVGGLYNRATKIIVKGGNAQ